MHLCVHTFREKDGHMEATATQGAGSPAPPDASSWDGATDHRLLVIVVTADDHPPGEAMVAINVSPAIIKGWAIYQMEKVRLTEGGMIGDKRAVFTVQQLTPRERVRIDLLVKGPPGKEQVTLT
ncbi:MAG: hypothetical protein ACP5EK_02040 [Thermoplasmatota archaeon]